MTSDQPSLFEDADKSAVECELHTAQSLLALSLLPGIGNARALRIAHGFDSWDAFLGASPDLVHRVSGVGIEYLHRPSTPEIPEGVRLVGRFDADYPAGLLDIPNAPVVLWIRGSLPDPAPRIAIVGARKASAWAIRMAESIARDAAQAGVTVVSGLAFGIDIAAHRGALAAGGETVAVLGSGVDVPSPNEHAADAREIVEAGGALVSEMSPGTPASPRSLVSRNRLQSGLSFATVIVECGLKSGTMTTAKFAVEQGRRLAVTESPEGLTGLNAGSRALVEEGVTHRRRTTHAEVLTTHADFVSLLQSATTN